VLFSNNKSESQEKKRLKQFSTALALALAFITIGCSSSNKTTTTPSSAQGVFSGTTSNGSSFQSIILPNDIFYAIYGTTSGNVLYISGMMTGQGALHSVAAQQREPLHLPSLYSLY
jgi:hypothetical protein